MKNQLVKLIPFVLAALVPAVGCGKAPTSPSVTPTLSGAEFVLTGVISEDGGDEGLPLAGVDLVVSQAAEEQDMCPGSRTATTDEDGRFSVSVTRGSWKVALSKAGFADRTIILSVDGNATINFSMLKLEAAKARAARR